MTTSGVESPSPLADESIVDIAASTPASVQEFSILLRQIQQKSRLTAGQIAIKAKVPRSTAYHFVSKKSFSLPKDPRQLVAFLRACDVDQRVISEMLESWTRLRNTAATQRQMLVANTSSVHGLASEEEPAAPESAPGSSTSAQRALLRLPTGLRSRSNIHRPTRANIHRPTIWTSIVSAVTALTAVCALTFTALSLGATRDQAAVNTETIQEQFTDRYTKAVEQIGRHGADHLQVRLGGIYALERLAYDSPRDQPTIIEVLSAFVRTTAPTSIKTNGLNQATTCPDETVSPDIQAALTILGRRDSTRDANAFIDLRNTCLRRAQLDGVNLRDANLVGADLTAASLTGSDLANANLTDAYLTTADLSNADLSNADLTNARFTGANLTGAHYSNMTVTSGTRTDSDTRGAWW